MDRQFKSDNAKDRFAVEHVVPFLLERIRREEDSKRIVDLATSMCVFPFKTRRGTRLGCLNEPGVSWYFARDDDKSATSTKSYRILDTRVLKKEDANSFKELFGRLDLISEYSEAVVINGLIDRMSMESDYTTVWWECAYDVFGLWKRDKSRVILADATKSIESNAFFFQDDCCPSDLREQLIRFGIYRDIKDGISKRYFWDRLPRGGEEKAAALLIEMGVPSTFVTNDEVSPRILTLITSIAETVDFDIELGERDRELCDLCHRLIFERVYEESDTAFQQMVSRTDSGHQGGIPVLNVRGSYVPLSFDLFYADDDILGEQPQKNLNLFGTTIDELLDPRKKRTPITVTASFAHLHIDAKKYKARVLKAMSSVHNFKEVHKPFSEYSLGNAGTRGGAANFYKWVWNRSQNEELAHNILRHYSGDGFCRPTIPEADIQLVLDALDVLRDGDSTCSFEIVMGAGEAFDEAKLLNRIPRAFPGVLVVIYGEFQEFDPHKYLEAVLEAATIDYATRRSIRADDIWENAYLTSGTLNDYAETYLQARIFTSQSRKRSLFFWPSYSEDSYTTAVARYIDDTYGTTIADAIALDTDWKEQYRNLVAGIRWFLNEYHETTQVEEVYGNVAALDDVKTFGEEKRIWQELQRKRNEYYSGSVPGHNAPRAYLSSTYQGRCQLCGGRTAMGVQRSYYWTFRIVKESENALANLPSNIFCLCPACHGELQYGSFMGKDMSSLVKLAKEYSSHIQRIIDSNEFDDGFPSAVEELANDEIEIEGFHRPIVCKVVVNGTPRDMAFSWEHFMRLAFMFSNAEE